MAFIRRNNKLWFFEDLYSDTAYGFEVSKIIVPETKTKFQKLMLLETPRFGKVFILDGIVQFTEEDEAIYHEMIAHWPLLTHPHPKSVLIIGGGDGGVLREVVKHKNVKKIYLVEIDPEVTKICRKYLPEISRGAFSDPRVKVFHCDAAQYVKRVNQKFDVVIMDTTDPIGPAKSLFSAEFIQDTYKIMNEGGILIRQAGSVILQPYELRGNWRQLEVIFGKGNVKTLLISSTTYFGGFFSLIAARKGKNHFDKELKVPKQQKIFPLNTQWYSNKIHYAAQILPPALQAMLEKEKYGEEIIIDLQNVSLPSFDKLCKWSSRTCKAINMLAFGKPMVSEPSMTLNTSFVQYIETSAINYRHCQNIGCANIFTCAELPINTAIDFSMKFFNTTKSLCWYLPRGSFQNLKEIQAATCIFESKFTNSNHQASTQIFHPTLINSQKIFSSFFQTPIKKISAPAFELIMDLYDCDYQKISSSKEVIKWARELCRVMKVNPKGKADAPDFGHAKKKTAGPSVTQFFEGGSNISHYSANWLCVLINIVSKKEFNLKSTILYSMKYFKAKRALGWILPRGLDAPLPTIAKNTFIFEINV